MTPPAPTQHCYRLYFVQRVAAIGQTSMALGIPMAIPHSALVIGFGGTASKRAAAHARRRRVRARAATGAA